MSDDQLVHIDSRRKEFGDFLRSRRERLTPAAVGQPNGFRRRTPGLRREEVALLAGVGTTWYTWLEQGRDVQPSVEVLKALAEVRRIGVHEGWCYHHVQAILLSIDQYAEAVTGNREFFWNKPHSIGRKADVP